MSVEPTAPPTARRPGPRFRPSWSGGLVLLTLLAIVGMVVANQADPATSDREAQDRLSVVVTAGGNVALLLLAVLVCLGLVLSHPLNDRTWRVSRSIFPWHRHLWIFVLAFVVIHVAGIVLDPFARVSVVGALVPGSSAYRSVAVALGTMTLYAFLITVLVATHPNLVSHRAWLVIHRVSIVVFALAWLHVYLIGSDSGDLDWLHWSTGVAVVLAAVYRLWAARLRRPTFVTSLAG